MCGTYGLGKDGAREVLGTGRRGYDPLLAVIAGTGDVAHARLRRGRSNDATLPPVFIKETISGGAARARPVRSCCGPTPGSTSTTWRRLPVPTTTRVRSRSD